jgi:hypothetical protein
MEKKRSMHILLVIDSNPANNWYRVFKGLKGEFAQCPPPTPFTLSLVLPR